MISLIILLIVLFVPATRRILLRMLSTVFGALGLVFLVSRNPPSRRKW